jgi:FolB domain-containing protein
MDKIIIRDLVVHGILGVYDHERTRKQAILINLEIYVDTMEAGLTDSLGSSVDYAEIADALKSDMERNKRLTVEGLATDIVSMCFATDRRIEKVKVRVEKPEALESAASAGIEIERTRPDFQM